MAEEGKASYSKVNLYDVKDDKVIRTRRTCPECGPGVFLAKHKDRESCGRCGHTEFTKKPEPKPEAKKSSKKEDEAEAADEGDDSEAADDDEKGDSEE